MPPGRIIAAYLLFQSAAIAGWWLLLLLVPASVAWFQPAAWPRAALLGYWLSDLLLLAGGSLIAATLVLRNDCHARLAIWGLTAAAWYPTLTCIGASLLTGEAWIAAGLMVCLAGTTLAMATIYGTQQQSPALFRATPLAPRTAVAWTIVQIAIFWSVFLGILPAAVIELQHYAGIAPFCGEGQTLIAAALFLTASLLGIWSAAAMALVGRGTPLPTAAASCLVIAGPYRYVRNPMAIAGILQAVAVGLFWGSGAVIAFALLGAILWHALVRPTEEVDLRTRFGDAYLRYQETVGLWLPRVAFAPVKSHEQPQH